MQKPDLSRIPLTPGVYLYKDSDDRVLYVGKAKVLRKRLASYFRELASLAPKTRALVMGAESLETISTSTEKEALLLEASLIKKHRPRYNIVLRDDKEYQVFRIDYAHPYPRLEITRNAQRTQKKGKNSLKKEQVHLYGPFSSALDARNTWKAIHRIFPLRRCTNRAFSNRSRTCLYYHMKQCLAPCIFDIDSKEYAAMLRQVDLLLSGRSRELVQQLSKEMDLASDALNFELAATLRDQIRAVEKTVERQSVVLPDAQDMDVLGVSEGAGGLALGLLHIRQGSLLGGRNFFWAGLSIEDAGELILSFLLQFYTEGDSIPPRIVAPWLESQTAPSRSPSLDEIIQNDFPENFETDTPVEFENTTTEIADLEALFTELRQSSVHISSPKSMDEERLVTIATTNAKEHAKNTRHTEIPELLARQFGVSTPIRRIEAVDISHTGGEETRAGMVVFEDGKPKKEDWRSYAFTEEDNIKGDDYAALSVWAKRRAKSGPPWPDLLLIDGGKGQLAVVCKAMQKAGVPIKTVPAHTNSPEASFDSIANLSSEGSTKPVESFVIASIAKARDEEGYADRRAGNVSDRIFLPGRSNPLPFKSGSQELLFLQYVRDHVHDFSIGRHRKARSDASMRSELSRIPGLGPSFAAALWEKFGSIAAMAAATEEELRSVSGIGKERGKALKKHLSLLVEEKKA